MLAMMVRLAGDANDFAKVTRLDGLVRGAIAKLDPKKYAPELEVAYGGFVATNMLEHDALAEDLVLATLIVLAAWPRRSPSTTGRGRRSRPSGSRSSRA